MNTKAIFSAFILTACFASAQAQTITPEQVSKVVDAYQSNEARFISTFRGKKFEGQFTLKSVDEDFMSKNTFNVYFEMDSPSIYCTGIRDKNEIKKISKFNKGQIIYVSGLIQDVVFGDLNLIKCKLSPQK